MRCCAAFLLLVIALWAPAAYGQPPDGAGGPPSPAGSGGAGADPAAAGSGEGGDGSPEASSEPTSEYQRHLTNGVKLYQDGDFRAAIAEFEAAYRADPKASPLINIALSFKALHDYPRAIEALDRAIKHHIDTIKPEHLDAAKREITELRQLLAYVTVRVHPPGATLLIDGEARPAGSAGKPIALSPGPHQLRAELAGHHPAEQQVTLTAGEHRQDIMLVLTPSGGAVRVVLRDRDAWVQVDSLPPAQGGWEGTLPAGLHHISVFRHGDSKRRSIEVLVGAGKSHVIIQDEEGNLASAAEVPDVPPDAPEDDEERQGFFFLGHGVFLGIVNHPDDFTPDPPAGGAGLGACIGYRVADWAAFEGLGQLTALGAKGTYETATNSYEDVEYDLLSMRLGGGFRVMAPGRSTARFVGVGAGGLTIEHLSWSNCPTGTALLDSELVEGCPYADTDGVGVGGFGQVDLGVELEFSNVLLDAIIQNTIQSTKGLSAGGQAPWGKKPVFLLGLSVHVGYGIW